MSVTALTITAGGQTLTAVRNVQYQAGISGVGESGISVSSFSFDALASDFTSISTAAAVTCNYIPNRTFYIDSRQQNGYLIHVECLDAAAFLDQLIELGNNDVTHVANVGDFVAAAVIVSKITAKCHNLTANIPWTPSEYGFPLESVQGKTFQEILTAVSEVCAGFYTYDPQTAALVLRYIRQPQSQVVYEYATQNYSVVNRNGTFEYQAVDIVTAYQTCTIGSPSAADFNTLTINNALCDYIFPTYDAIKTNYDMNPPTSEHYTYVDTTDMPEDLGLDDIIGVDFEVWSCDNAAFTAGGNLPIPGDIINFLSRDGTSTRASLRVTDINARFVGNIAIMSLSGAIPSGSEIGRRSRRQAEIDNKLTVGSTYGNWKPNPYQLIYMENAPEQETSGGGS